MSQLKFIFSRMLNYVAHKRGLSYLSNMHTEASGAEPVTIHATTIGSDAFIAANGFAEVLWILACKVPPFRSVPSCRIHRSHQTSQSGISHFVR